MMAMEFIDLIRNEGAHFELSDWSALRVTGRDRISFLNGQLTNDLNKLQNHEGQWSARVGLNGRLKCYCHIMSLEDAIIIMVKSSQEKVLCDELKKFIIMEDVHIETLKSSMNVFIGPMFFEIATKLQENFIANSTIFGECCALYWSEGSECGLKKLSDLWELQVLSGEYAWDSDVENNVLINTSTLNEIAVSYDKGCFFGQETVAKINNNRGASYYPVLLESEDKSLSFKKISLLENHHIFIDHSHSTGPEKRKIGVFEKLVSYGDQLFLHSTLLRDYRVDGQILKIFFENNQGSCNETEKTINLTVIVKYMPYFLVNTPELKANELYGKGINTFHRENFVDSLKLLKLCLALNPGHADALEILGVILGRQKKFQEGIEMMDKLLKLSPNSVMAHTNKSLFYMHLGEIEKAENEKSQALVKSFAQFGAEANEKKRQEAESEKKRLEIKKRKEIFSHVLKIDKEDAIANYGMADILYLEKDYLKAKNFVEQAIESSPAYSVAYLLLGKIYEGLQDTERARKVYVTGIEIAAKKGDLMPANAMQGRLVCLS